MSWAKWDADHRGANVRAVSSDGGFKVTSGGKHLGNIERRGDKHVAVVKQGRTRSAPVEFDSHEEALDHIRKAHGLSAMSSAQRLAARISNPSEKPSAKSEEDYLSARVKAVTASRETLKSSTLASHKAAHEAHARALELAPANMVNQHRLAMDTHQKEINKLSKAQPSVVSAATRVSPAPTHRPLDLGNSRMSTGDTAYFNSKRTAPKLSQAESDALDRYTHESFSINDHLRNGGSLESAPALNTDNERPVLGSLKDMDNAVGRSRLPEHSELWRGTEDAHNIFGPVGSRVGQRFVDHGFVSTTTDRGHAAEFGADSKNGAEIRIVAPKGTRGMAVGAHSVMQGDNEREILLHRGQTYHVAKDEVVGGKRHIEVHVIPEGG